MYTNSYSVKHNLRQLFMQHYERYLPTAFDESMSLLEKMNKLIKSQNELIEAMNTHTEHTSETIERGFDILDKNIDYTLNDFRDELTEQTRLYEEIRDKIHSDLLPDSVKQKLEEWLLDGTIKDLISDTVFPDFIERMTQLENRMEEMELLEEVSLNDFYYLAEENSDGTLDWSNAMNHAASVSKYVVVPEGEYYIDPVRLDESHSGLTIAGRGESTRIRVNDGGGSNLFHLEGSMGEVKRVSSEYERGSDILYLDDTSGLSHGDDIIIQSQKNCLSYEDSGDEWLLGSGTGDNPQRVPFAEFGVVDEVYEDRIKLFRKPIFPHYNSHSGDENHPVFDFSRVRKINFVKNVHIKDLTVDYVNSGYVFRTKYAKNCSADNVKFIDSPETSGNRGVARMVMSYGCEVRNSFYEAPLTVGLGSSGNYWMQNPFTVASAQNCGFLNCRGENTAQMVDFSFFADHMPNVGGYIKDCTSINAGSSAFTTHGGNYLLRFTGNYSEGSSQGFAHRGRGAVISDNVLIGTSYDNAGSTLASGVALYQGGAVDSVITGNQIRNFSNAVSYSDGETGLGGRARVLNTVISNNVFDGNRVGVRLWRYHTGTVPDEDMNVLISDNQFIMKNSHDHSAVSALTINERNQGVTVRGNTFKGIRGETIGFVGDRTNNFTAVTILPNADKIYVMDNIFMDIDRGISHNGTYNAYTSGVYPDGVDFYERDNHYIRVRQDNRYREGVNDLSTLWFTAKPTAGITTSGSVLTLYSPDGHKFLRESDNFQDFILPRGVWNLSYTLRVSAISADEIVTVTVERNGESLVDYQIRDGSSHTLNTHFKTRTDDVVRLILTTNDPSSVSTVVSGSTGQSKLSLVQIGN